jgi:uncharacterized protein
MIATTTNLDDTSTWIKYTQKLCKNCSARCCSLAVEVKKDDLVRMGLIDEFEIDENPKKLAKRLRKEGYVEHFYHKKEQFTLARMANGDCIFLDSETRRCNIYDKRPDTCRQHPIIGPRPGYCAFLKK